MSIKAADVNKLRQMTGAGMMDCKKALQETGGDLDEAITFLRKKGQKVSEKRADREASEGAVFANVTGDQKTGILIQLNCETDFVAKNKDFVTLGEKISKVAIENTPETLDDLLKTDSGNNSTIEDLLKDEMAKIGEKIEVSSYHILKSDSIVTYIHAGNQIGVLVALNKPHNADIERAGRDVAMQIAAMNPLGVDENDIPADVVEKEKELIKHQVQQEGKPENIAEKIAEGKLKKFYKERSLLHQEFVKDPSVSIKKYLQSVDNDLTVTAFKRDAIGY